MKKLVTLMLTAVLALSAVFGVAAQDAGSGVAVGTGTPVTWTDDRGSVVGTLQVNEVEIGWSGYEENRGPERGYDFVAVHFTVTNDSGAAIEVNPSRFSLVDSFGLNNGRAWVRAAEGTEVLDDTVNVEAGESLDATVVYQIFTDVTPALFVWQPESGKLLSVVLTDGSEEESSVAMGIGTPAVWGDDRGNIVASMQVNEVEEDWQDYSEYSAPGRGERYVAVHFTVTNLSDAPLELNPYYFSMVDSEGTNNGRSYVSAADDADPAITSDEVEVAPGESIDGVIVFVLYDGVDPNVFIWQGDYGSLTAVLLTGDSAAPADGEATPEDEDSSSDAADLLDNLGGDDEDAESTPAS